MPGVYLDVCCLSRPFDDQSQPRIRLESQAVSSIIEEFKRGSYDLIVSDVVMIEIDQIRDDQRRERTEALLNLACKSVQLSQEILIRARELLSLGFQNYDALHIASAEHAKVDVLLTTDDRLLKRADRLHDRLHVSVSNPVTWLLETEPK